MEAAIACEVSAQSATKAAAWVISAAATGMAEAPKLQLAAILITALGSIVLFAYPQFLFNLLRPLVGL